MSTLTLERETFKTNRAMEFFTEKELSMQIGYQRSQWPIVLVKELIDNALDACEQRGVAPRITVTLEADAVTVQDNGPGLPAEVLQESLDYMIRVSNKSGYVSPTRGQLGNALKCVWAAPFVIDGEHGKVEVHSHGRAHTIDVTLDRIAQEPVLEHTTGESHVKTGTLVKIYWPSVASYLAEQGPSFYKAVSITDLIHYYAAFNPHAGFSLAVNEEVIARPPADTLWGKWRPDMPTSAHWYSPERLRSLIAAYLSGTRKNSTVREFVSEFDGLSSTAKQKVVTDACNLTGARLTDLVAGNDLSGQKIESLLYAMKQEAREVKTKKLGVIGEAHLKECLYEHHFCNPGTIWYKKAEGAADGLPYVLELALGVYRDDYFGCARSIITGLNFSPVLKVPFNELSSLLGENRVDGFDPVVVVVHLTCPRLDFTDRGKSSLTLPQEIKDALEKGVRAVSKAWKQLKNQTDRDGRVRERALKELHKPKHLSIKDAAYRVMEDAYKKASANGTLPTHARQIMYAARDAVLAKTGGKFYKNSASFTQGDLPNFMMGNPELTANWDVVFDARGRFVEPHTGSRTDLGTLEVRRYLSNWTALLPDASHPELNHACPTVGPKNRYRFALFIEKEGFYPLLEATKIAQRFDLAVMSTKGMSVTAARRLVEALSAEGVTILVVRDFDKAGFSIAHTLKTSTRRYQFDSTPRVIDLGLRLKDVEAMGLQGEPVEYKDKVDPRVNLQKRGATPEECDFLVSGVTYSGAWKGHRVELNAMASDRFITWLEGKLIAAGVGKVTPADEVLRRAYTRARKVAVIQEAIDEAVKGLSENVFIPGDLQERISKRIEGTDTPWDEALWQIAKETEKGVKR